MEHFQQLFWATIGALLGGIFGLLFSIARERAQNFNSDVELFGNWHSTWQPTHIKEWYWVTESVEISNKWGKLYFENRDNTSNFGWVGKAKLINKTYLIGEWKSANPGSPAEGVFMLTFTVSGNCLIGYFMSRDTDRDKLATQFVLSRTSEGLEKGKKQLAKAPIVA